MAAGDQVKTLAYKLMRLLTSIHGIMINTNFVAHCPFIFQLLVKGDIHCEASYYNEKLSIWEPLLEPLENSKGRLEQWVISTEVNGSSGTVILCLTHVIYDCYKV